MREDRHASFIGDRLCPGLSLSTSCNGYCRYLRSEFKVATDEIVIGAPFLGKNNLAKRLTTGL